MSGWYFALLGHGQKQGFNNSGIETYSGDRLENLAREISQNSLDAHNPNIDEPVKIHFELHSLFVDKFPSKADFMYVLESSKEYWEGISETKEFFQEALKIMEQEEISILKVSDYNTTGLTDSDKGQDAHDSKWNGLVASEGVSNKPSNAGGSYGIGKYASFTCSNFRTVFYGTRDLEGKTAFQGVSKLVTHKNRDGKRTQGTGYYGIKGEEQINPIRQFEGVDEFFYRSEIGTDIFIPGFNGGEDWESKIIKAVLENFFVAVRDKRLIIKVGDTTISSETLPNLLEEYINDDSNYCSDKYYKALTSSKKHYFCEDHFEDKFSRIDFENDFEEIDLKDGLGQIELYVLHSEEENYPNQVAMVRNIGMKIKDKKYFPKGFNFAGVMIAKGEGLNKFLRKIEPPSHDDFKPDKLKEDAELAGKIRKKIRNWINEQVKSIYDTDEAEELDAVGMSQYLPDYNDGDFLGEDSGEEIEGETKSVQDIEIKQKSVRRDRVNSTAAAETAAASEEDIGSLATDGSKHNDEDGGEPSIELGGGSHEEGSGGRDNSGQGSRSSREAEPLKLESSRSFCIDPNDGVYKVIVKSKSTGKGFLKFNIVGETERELAPIKRAELAGEQIDIKSKGKIGPLKFEKGKKCELLIKLENSLRCAMEVNLDEN